MKFIKRDSQYLLIMDDGTEYEVDDNKLTKEHKHRIQFHHKNVKPLKDKVDDLEDVLNDIRDTVNDIKEKLET